MLVKDLYLDTFEMNRAMFKEQEWKMKALLDEYEKEEFD